MNASPLILVTDDDLVRVSNENPGYTFERERDGSVTVNPTSTRGGAQSGEAFAQLFYRQHGSSYAVAIDPETREAVEDGRAPDGLVPDFDAIIDA